MSSTENTSKHDEVLNDSWEELTCLSQASASPNAAASCSSSVIERLLRDAQRESSHSESSNAGSHCSYSTSPRSTRSLNTDVPPDNFEVSLMQGPCGTPCELATTDWVWDWSSRPEVLPPWASSPNLHPFKHPVSSGRRTYSIRNSRLMQSILVSLENLPLLLLTHACTFILGAATMLIILKKYYKFAAAASATFD